ncbi:MAG: prolipoprotein diacylglyceryl transferase [Clostridia bacterium]|nr:prolipoprotein diacylglyceryl transferase [Clostridia bacterium]
MSENRKRLGIKEPMAALLALVHTVVGVFSVKAFAFLESGDFSGMSLYGAVFFLPLVYYIGAKLTKRRVADVFDVFTFLTVFTLMLARINCLFGGCCLGKLVPWSDSVRWPTRELEIVFYVVLLFWFGRLSKKPRHSGKLYPLYMLSYGAFRFVVEWFRESENMWGFLHISHIWSLVAILVGASVYYKLSKRQTTGRTRRGKR